MTITECLKLFQIKNLQKRTAVYHTVNGSDTALLGIAK